MMAREMCADVGKRLLGQGLGVALLERNQQDLARLLQKRDRVAHGASAFARILPCDDRTSQLKRSNGVGHNQKRPARAQQNHTGID
jgi:hypothetical protein